MEDKFVPPGPLTTPVLFMIFNRPDTTQKVFNAIKRVKPRQFFVAADGPREGKEGEKERCEQAREIIEQVDWDCELKTLFRDKNLGCKIAVSSAIDWFLEKVEEGIILEDDCLPSQSFFWFCQELLKYYRNDTRVMTISGTNYGYVDDDFLYDYFFSKNIAIWGWATWKRAWRKYDINMNKFYEVYKHNMFKLFFPNNQEYRVRLNNFKRTLSREIDTWDYQWSFTCLINDGLSIIPKINLVENIGFGEGATHTKKKIGRFLKVEKHELKSIEKYPMYMVKNFKYEDMIRKTRNINCLERIKNYLIKYII